MTAWRRIFLRDLRISLRQGTDLSMVVMFFIITAALFPFGIGPEPTVLARIAPGVVAVCAMLAVLLSLDRIFLNDYEDGSLDLLTMTALPLEAVVLAKVAAHWVLTGLPLIVAAPFIGLMLNMPDDGYATLVAVMALVTPTLSLIGAVGASLTLGARRAGVLVSILVLPLYIPARIFATAAIDAAIMGLPVRPYFYFLGAMLAAAVPLAPWASAAAIRQSLQ
jgi:heme exporter protein B